jgi:hypothetical protein
VDPSVGIVRIIVVFGIFALAGPLGMGWDVLIAAALRLLQAPRLQIAAGGAWRDRMRKSFVKHELRLGCRMLI